MKEGKVRKGSEVKWSEVKKERKEGRTDRQTEGMKEGTTKGRKELKRSKEEGRKGR